MQELKCTAIHQSAMNSLISNLVTHEGIAEPGKLKKKRVLRKANTKTDEIENLQNLQLDYHFDMSNGDQASVPSGPEILPVF